jgi:hypothetical protein
MKSNSNSVRLDPGRVELLVALLCFTLAFGLAARVGPQVEARLAANGVTDDNPVARWLGDSRQMFANSFFVKADAYYHSGYYPTIYDDNTPFKTPHIGEDSSTMKSKNSGDETTIFSHPNNWVERFELNFFPSYHTHLDEGGVDGNGAEEVKEIMPWLKISAELDEHRIDTYLVTAYWLRRRMHKVDEAEQFLRDGLPFCMNWGSFTLKTGIIQTGLAIYTWLRSPAGSLQIPAKLKRTRTPHLFMNTLPVHSPSLSFRNTTFLKPSGILNC